MLRNTLLFLPIVLLLSSCATNTVTQPYPASEEVAAQYEPMKSELIPWISRQMKFHQITGMSLAVVDNGDVVWAQGFGYADKAQDRAATAETLYKAGSISKLFTATAIMQLVEQGRVDLDAPIQTYIPELKPRYHTEVTTPITLRQIMRHRSGLPGDKLSGMFTENPERFDSVITYLNQVHSPYEPGTVTAYSNVATSLQGIVVERVTGESFEDYIEKHLLSPLGMNTSTFADDKVDTRLLSKAYHRNEERIEPGLRDVPAGNLYSSALELSRFATMAMRQGEPLVQPATLEQMLTPPADEQWPNAMGIHVGLNWVVNRPSLAYLGRTAEHDGATIFFNSSLIVLPDQKLSVVVLANSPGNGGFVTQTAERVLREAAFIKTGLRAPEPSEPAPVADFPVETLKDLPGLYAGILGPLEMEVANDKAKTEVNGLTLKLKYREDGWMSPHPRLFGFIPLPIKQITQSRLKVLSSGENKYLLARFNGTEIIAGKAVPPYLLNDKWRSLAGTYRVQPEDGDNVLINTLLLEDRQGLLIATLDIDNMGQVKVLLRPISENMAVVEGVGRWMQDAGCRMQDAGCRMQDAGCRKQSMFIG